MNFDNSTKPIYLQIADNVCEMVLSGELKSGDKILSVREFSAQIAVNPNTVARAYDTLAGEGIIFNKRGLGYFIGEDAHGKVLDMKRRDFMERQLPEIRKTIKLLGIDPAVFQ